MSEFASSGSYSAEINDGNSDYRAPAVTPVSTQSNTPKIAVKFANIVFALGMVFSIIGFIYTAYKIYNAPSDVTLGFYFISISFFTLSAGFFGFSLLRLSNNLKVNLSILFVTTGVVVYGFETYLEVHRELSQRAITEKQTGVPYDTRTKLEVLEDLTNSGIETYLNFGTGEYLIDNDKSIYILGGISNITTILDNESGYFPIVETDEHGFNNPKGLYKKNKVDIVLTGDSFTEGLSVHPEETIGAVLRKIGFTTISVGKYGNGPMKELAAIKEYAEPLKPKIVLWLFFRNDVRNLKSEMQEPLLRKYLYESNFSQNLISRQGGIDDILIGFANKARENERGIEASILDTLYQILKLTYIRKYLNVHPEARPFEEKHGELFSKILRKSNEIVSGWGGQLYIVYLPQNGREYPLRKSIYKIANDSQIPFIDLHENFFELHSNPSSLFPPAGGHYNAEGYRLTAETIAKRLRADGLLQ